jgi:hypothetical protein
MYELLTRIIDAHGGIDGWNRHERVEAPIVSGGGLFRLKVPRDSFVGQQMGCIGNFLESLDRLVYSTKCEARCLGRLRGFTPCQH